MILIVGLGNPGEKFSNTRHNIGYMVLDNLSRKLDVSFKEDKYILSDVVRNSKYMLIKPKTYINLSGSALKKVLNDKDVSQTNLWVIHDDADLSLGEVRVKIGGTSGGH